MSRPKGTKNTMRSVEEKIKILQEYYDTGMNAPLIYRKYNGNITLKSKALKH